ncbi:MAG TPA: hypothetical protein DD671_05885 [Balneolaceae bacterium]|nr:hypothetical protein [Balneolaceae bacterium]
MRIDKVYNKLKEELSDEEIAESYMIPETDSIQEEEMQYEIKKYREQRLDEMSKKEKMMSKLIELKFLMEEYVKNESFSFHKTFGTFLEEYISVVERPRKQI